MAKDSRENSVRVLTSIPGVGKATAEKLVNAVMIQSKKFHLLEKTHLKP